MSEIAGTPHERVHWWSRILTSVRWRITMIVTVVVGVTLLLGGYLLIQWVEATLVNDVQTRNDVALSSMARVLNGGQLPSELLLNEADLERQLTSGGVSELNEVLGSTFFYIDGSALDSSGVAKLDEQGRLLLFGRSLLPPDEGEGYIESSRTLVSDRGDLVLHAVTPRVDVKRSVNALSGALLVVLPALVFAAGGMAWVVAGRTLAPVSAMSRRVRELSATNLDARVPVPPSHDEIAQLANTMNQMLERLQRSADVQRQFVSDASHELRSPVASIRAQLETALRYPEDVDWPQVATVVLAEDERLDHLVGNLLAMARLEEGRFGRRTEVDLEDLVVPQARRFTDVATDLSEVSAGRVWGNAGELTSVVRNLTDNAVRHADSEVCFSLQEAGPWVVLKVCDDGSGVDPSDRQRIFERFARLEEGRTRDSGGAGLGLALSRRIVEHHGGHLHVEDSPTGGACFVVSLPSAHWSPEGEDAPARTGASA
ncbi:MAG: HAMP domain-containing sensor histidine kinase [Microthrixaceae bacterium]